MVFDADGDFADAGFIAARIAGYFVCDNQIRRQRGRLQREDKDYPNLNE